MSKAALANAQQGRSPERCSACGVRPRLGALSRCGDCVRAEAEVDRQSRQAAESRVATRKSAKEAEARATAERHAALEKLGELYLQFAASPEGIRLAEAQQAELTAPRNDAAYLQTLEDHEKDRTLVANQTATVHHTVDGGRSWLSIGLTNPRDHARASEAARVLGRHLEAPVIRHEDPEGCNPLGGSSTSAARQAYLRQRSAKPWKQKHGTASDR